PIEQIFERFGLHGDDEYGRDRVKQIEHALQCAALAEEHGAAPALITASLLHDIGHLIHDLGHAPAARGIDDRHEVLGQEWLTRWFGPAVTEPVRLHVDAKRYLTGTDPGYFTTLSPGSVRSLELQGGPFSAEGAAEFIDQPYAADAVRLRRWDEGAKVVGKVTPNLAHFRQYIEASLSAA
ncbi:MAG TPA: HD domain-containing protein, partial [Stellaceae bacterium]|nr:HD domain-containing protein [Stellaceae bacterium]